MANKIAIPIEVQNNTESGWRSVYSTAASQQSQLQKYLTLEPLINTKSFSSQLRRLESMTSSLNMDKLWEGKSLSKKGKNGWSYDLKGAMTGSLDELRQAMSDIKRQFSTGKFSKNDSVVAQKWLRDAEFLEKTWDRVNTRAEKYAHIDKGVAQDKAAAQAAREREKAEARIATYQHTIDKYKQNMQNYDGQLYRNVQKRLTAEQQIASSLRMQEEIYRQIGDKKKAAAIAGQATKWESRAIETSQQLENWTGNDKGLIYNWNPENIKRQINAVSRDLTNQTGRENILSMKLNITGWEDDVKRLRDAIKETEKKFTIGGKKFEIRGIDDAVKALAKIDKMAEKGVKGASAWQQRINNYLGANVSVANKYQTYQNKIIESQKREAKAFEDANKALGRQGGLLGRLGVLASRYVSIFTAVRFVKNIIDTTGYFQQQQVALEGILVSASKARTVLADIKDFALKSPFQTKELVNFTKQLGAFGIKGSDLFPTVKELADISAGLGVDMGRIILAYGQVKSAAVLRGQELRQFTEAGIPMVQALADKFKVLNGTMVTTADVFKLISERKVPFEMVASVLSDMTKEGGKFYKMQENITNTTYGQVQKLKDMWTIMLDSIGKDAGGLINRVIKSLQGIVKNIKPISIAVSGLFIGKGIGVATESLIKMYRAIKAVTMGLKGLAFARGLVSGIATAVGAAFGIIVSLATRANEKQKELQRNMKEIADGFTKDTTKMTSGLDSLATKITAANIGTKKFADAVSTLSQNYGDFISDDIIQKLQGTDDACVAVANSFMTIVDAIKEAIKYQQQYQSLMAQSETAGNASSTNTTETLSGQKNRVGITTRHDILSKTVYSGGQSSYTQSLVKDFLTKNKDKGLTYEGLKNAIITIVGSSINNAVKDGITLDGKDVNGEQTNVGLRDYIQESILKSYALNQEEISAIMDNIMAGIDTYSYNKAVETRNAAGSMTYAKALKPFEDIQAKIQSGNYAGRTTDDAITQETTISSLWRNALRRSFADLNLTGYDSNDENSAGFQLRQLLEQNEYDNSTANAILNKIQEFKDTFVKTAEDGSILSQDSQSLALISTIQKQFLDNVNVRTGHSERIANAFGDNAKINDKRLQGWRKDKDLTDIVAAYGKPTVETYDKLREQLQADKSKVQSDIANMKKGVYHQADLERLQKREAAYTYLQEDKLYGIEDKKQKGGGYRQLFTDMFNLIKTAKDQQKQLVEGADGYTQALIDDIDKLENSPLKYFYEGGVNGNPFAQFLDKIQEYGIEGDIFKAADFEGLRNKYLTGVGVDNIDTADFAQIWKDLIDAGKKKADTLTGKDQKSEKESLLSFLRNMEIQFEKIFGQDEIADLISQAIKSLSSIERNTANINTRRGYFDRLTKSSNYMDAQQAIYGNDKYITHSKSNVSKNALRRMLTSTGGAGIASTDAGQKLEQIVNGGSLDISNLNGLLAITTSLQKEAEKKALTATNEVDEGERQKAVEAAEQFKGVVGMVTSEIKNLTDAILEEFELMQATRSKSEVIKDELINLVKTYTDKLNMIDKLSAKDANGNSEIDEETSTRRRIEATQELYNGTVKGLGGEGLASYVMSLFGKNNGKTGIRKGGMAAQVLLGDNSLKGWNAMRLASGVTAEKGTEEYKKQMEEAAKAAEEFAARLDMASAIVKKIDGTIQDIVKFGKSIIGALEANNGLTKDEYGNYKKENDYSGAKAALDMISSTSSTMQSAFTSLTQGNIIGAATQFGTAIADFFTYLFNENDRRIQKQQDQILSNIKSMDKELSQLDFDTQWSNGLKSMSDIVDKSKLLNEEAQKYAELEELENEKKGGDAEKAEEYENQKIEKERESLNLLREMKESIMGTADELSSTLTDAMMEAFRNGTNAARAWRDSVKTYMQDIVQQMLFDKVFAGQIDDIMNQWAYGFQDMYDENGKLVQTAEEQARAYATANGIDFDEMLKNNLTNEDKAKQTEQALGAVGDAEIDLMNSLPQYLQDLLKFKQSDSSLSGGIESITEDTARRLEALLNSTLGEQLLTRLNTDTLVVSVDAMSNQLRSMVGQNEVIKNNTTTIVKAMEEFRNNVRPMYVKMA